MVGLRKPKALLFVVLVVLAISIAYAAKDLKEKEDVGTPRLLHEEEQPKKEEKGKKDEKEEKGKKDEKDEKEEKSVGSKIKDKVKGAAASVASAASNASSASAATVASAASAASGKIKGAVSPIGDKLGLKGGAPAGPSIDVKTCGAKGDGKTDDSAAFMDVWKKAIAATTPTTILVPKGDYLVDNLELTGPSKCAITIEMHGNLKAPSAVTTRKPHSGWIEFKKLEGLVLNGNGAIFDGQGSVAWKVNDCKQTGKCNNLPINIRLTQLNNSKICAITSTNSKLFHMNIHQCNNVTLQDVHIDAPPESLNTDGIHLGRSVGVTIRGSKIKTGDDCISIGHGTENLLVEGVECGPGHGLSIGSLGKYPNETPVKGITIRKSIIKHTDNGVRIKTWPGSPPGLVSNVLFEDITMDNVSLPVLIDQVYCPHGKCKSGPSKIKLENVNFKNIHGTSSTKIAVQLNCSPGCPCENVCMENINLVSNSKEGAAVSACSNVKPIVKGKVIPAACTEECKPEKKK